MIVHNHGPEEGAGLACNESRLPDGSLQGACLMTEEEDRQKELARAVKELKRVVEEDDEDHIVRGTD